MDRCIASLKNHIIERLQHEGQEFVVLGQRATLSKLNDWAAAETDGIN